MSPAEPRSPRHGTPPLSGRLVDVVPFEAGGRGRPPLDLPLLPSRLPTGFVSPADDHVEATINVEELCVRNAAATYFGVVEGESMVGLGIYPDDYLVVDRSVEPRDGDVVVATLNGELTVKRLRVGGENGSRRAWLVSGSEDYPAVEVLDGHELVVWGVATRIIRKLRG